MSWNLRQAAVPLPGWFMIAVGCLWAADLALIIVGSLMAPLQHHAPWESSGLSHFLAYAGLGLLPMLLRPGWRWTLTLFLAASGFGALIEWIQTFIPGRYGTVDDVLINVAGLAVGIVAGFLLEKPVTHLLAGKACRGRTVS